MITCPKCKASVNDDALFCTECGCSLKDVSPEVEAVVETAEAVAEPETPAEAAAEEAPVAEPEAPVEAAVESEAPQAETEVPVEAAAEETPAEEAAPAKPAVDVQDIMENKVKPTVSKVVEAVKKAPKK